jgi:hypothetical protein
MSVMDRIRGRTTDGDYDRDRVVERPGPVAAEAYQRDRFGGLNWGAAFFGWLVAVGLAVLLTALLAAAGAAVAISEVDSLSGVGGVDTVSLGSGIALLVITLISYFAGGYVAGRMSRFDGARQGFGVWVWAIVVTVILALIGLIAGEEWNIFAGLDLPRIPIDEDATAGGIALLVAALILTLLAAMAGGKAGENYHRRVDRAGFDADDRVPERTEVRDRPVERAT